MAFKITDFGTIVEEAKRLEGMKNAARYMSPVMNRILIDMARATSERIKSQGRRGGGSWKGLAERTIEKKGMTAILYTTGARAGYHKQAANTLVRSVTVKSKSGQNAIREADEHSVTFGTEVPYSWAQQKGYPPKNIPARPFIQFTAYDIARWEKWILEHLTQPHRVKSKKV